MTNKFLQVEEVKSKEAKWNMFRFQDHLMDWISLSAQYFQARDYPSSFEALTNVYSDTYGFFNEKEKKYIDELFDKTFKDNNAYLTYNINFEQINRRVRNQTYAPPQNIYRSLLDFRKELMTLMTKYQLTIPQIKKGSAGAASQ